jgi:hypothetical protein
VIALKFFKTCLGIYQRAIIEKHKFTLFVVCPERVMILALSAPDSLAIKLALSSKKVFLSALANFLNSQ